MRPVADHPLTHLTLARFRELLREPGIVFWVFGFPVVLALLLGLAFRDAPPRPTQVAVEEGLAVTLPADAFEVAVLPRREAREALRRGRVQVAVESGPAGPVLRHDPRDAEQRLARALVAEALLRGAGPGIAAETVTERGARYIDFLVPGLLGLNLMSSSLWGLAFGIVLARKRGMLKRFAATPMRRSHYLASFVLSRLGLLLLEVAALLVVAWLVFDVVVAGSVAALLVVSVVGAASFGAIGLLIAARIDNTEVASGWMNFVMLPMWMLSGSFFSYERFPEAVHPLIRLLPLTALNDALRAILRDGEPLAAQAAPLLVLAAWGALGFAVASRRFKWQ